MDIFQNVLWRFLTPLGEKDPKKNAIKNVAKINQTKNKKTRVCISFGELAKMYVGFKFFFLLPPLPLAGGLLASAHAHCQHCHA
jgi:hypothetical protein